MARIIQDHYDVLEGIFDFVGGNRELSTSYVKELHASLLRNQDTYGVVDELGRAFEKPLEKGQYKTEANSPTRPDGGVHEYCPPEHVAAEMDHLIQLNRDHQERGIPVEVEAAFLHHRFAQIHPFADGNGRVARALASLVFIKAGWFPVVVRRDEWDRYVAALESRDAGDLRPLVAMFVEGQRNAVIQASEIAYEVKPIETAHEAVVAARHRLAMQGKLSPSERADARALAEQLVEVAKNRLDQLAEDLRTEIGRVALGFSFGTEAGLKWGRTGNLARVLAAVGHVADFAEYDNVVRLSFSANPYRAFVCSFYALGLHYRGIIGVVAFLDGGESKLIRGGTFQINYEEPAEHAEARFAKWLDGVMVEGLKEWRLTL